MTWRPPTFETWCPNFRTSANFVISAGPPHQAGKSEAGSLGQPAAARAADDARPTGRIAEGVRPGGERAGEAKPGGGVVDDASGSGAGDFAGLCAYVRSSGAVRAEQAGGELPGTESARALLGRAAAAGSDLQARQSHDALVVGGSRTHRGAVRS